MNKLALQILEKINEFDLNNYQWGVCSDERTAMYYTGDMMHCTMKLPSPHIAVWHHDEYADSLKSCLGNAPIRLKEQHQGDIIYIFPINE